MSGVKEAIVRAITNLSFWLQAMDGVEGFDMCLRQIAQNVQGTQQVLCARRIVAKDVTLSCVAVAFVDGDPEIAEVLQVLYHVRDVAYEETDIVLLRKGASVGEP